MASTGDENGLTNGGTKVEEIKPKVDDDNQTCRTFVINNEDHTLGNPLRYVVMMDPRVEFCGYSVPHPAEEKINFRIQTDGSCSAIDALRTGTTNLQQAAEVLLKTFNKAIESNNKVKQEKMNAS